MSVNQLRRRFLLGLGAALFAVGAVTIAIGLIQYIGESESSGTDDPITELITVPSIDDVEGLPVAIPFYNPEAATATPEAVREVTSPLRMIIDGIEVDAPVIEMGLDDGGIPQVPLNGQDVAWYNFSSKPGGGSNAVFAGHINWAGAQGVFGRLGQLQSGDSIRLISKDGREYAYEVFGNFPVDPADPASLKVMAPTETDTITLITCGGTWIPDASERFGGNYTNRTIVQAKLMQPSVAAPVPAAISEG